MNNENSLRKIHFTMSVVGGFLGVYGLLIRNDLFGNSQTANIIYIFVSILGQNITDFIVRFLALLIYMLGAVIIVLLKKKNKLDIRIFSIFVDIAAIIILGFLPKHMDPVIGLYPIFFATSVQWNVFAGVHGYICSTIFSTNNLKQFTISTTEYILEHDKAKKHRATFYGLTLVFYHIGVVIGFFAVKHLSVKAAFVGIIPALLALALILVTEHVAIPKVETAK